MTQIYLNACETAFLALPILMLSLRAFGPRWFGAWTAILIVVILGWILVNVCIHLSFEEACATMENYGANPPQDVMDACTVDGAELSFGFLFGGFYALIYYAPFALIYEIARRARRLCARRRERI